MPAAMSASEVWQTSSLSIKSSIHFMVFSIFLPQGGSTWMSFGHMGFSLGCLPPEYHPKGGSTCSPSRLRLFQEATAKMKVEMLRQKLLLKKKEPCLFFSEDVYVIRPRTVSI